MLNVFVLLFSTFGRWFRRNHAWAILCFATLLSACAVGGSSTMPPLSIPKDRVHEVCWKPSKLEQQTILIRARNEAFQKAYDQQHAIAMALTQAEADIESVTKNDASWFKQALTSNPGSLEQIQQRVAARLNSIEEPRVYNDPILDMIALAGAQAGFENGKFKVEAKLFAIDVGVFLVEMALMEVALV